MINRLNKFLLTDPRMSVFEVGKSGRYNYIKLTSSVIITFQYVNSVFDSGGIKGKYFINHFIVFFWTQKTIPYIFLLQVDHT